MNNLIEKGEENDTSDRSSRPIRWAIQIIESLVNRYSDN